MRSALELPGLNQSTARRIMLGALEFTPFSDVAPALAKLHTDGHALIVVSNWDCSLPDWLRPAGILELVDGVVSSAEVGAAKPDPAPFRRGLELAASEPTAAIHVGDSLENDVEGARAAGIRPVLVARDGSPAAGVEAIHSLLEVPSLL
jgi:putative hydrolase of the HAD superfamily